MSLDIQYSSSIHPLHQSFDVCVNIIGINMSSKLLKAINDACAIIELGDNRLLAQDGPCGNLPPQLSLSEWKRLYTILNDARNGKK